MTKEKAIDVLNMLKDYYNDKNKYVDDEIGYVGFDDEDNEAIDMGIKALEAFEIPPHDNWDGYSSRLWKAAYERGKEDAEQKWIPVSERLPEKEMDCLVTDSLGKVHKVTFYHALDGRESYFSGCYCVRAWMPLPEPYRESEDKRTEERTETHACDCISRQVEIDEILREVETLRRDVRELKELLGYIREYGIAKDKTPRHIGQRFCEIVDGWEEEDLV